VSLDSLLSCNRSWHLSEYHWIILTVFTEDWNGKIIVETYSTRHCLEYITISSRLAWGNQYVSFMFCKITSIPSRKTTWNYYLFDNKFLDELHSLSKSEQERRLKNLFKIYCPRAICFNLIISHSHKTNKALLFPLVCKKA